MPFSEIADRVWVARYEWFDANVTLVGGGQLDVGPLRRQSPFPQAPAVRTAFGDRWLPGCHAEALLLLTSCTASKRAESSRASAIVRKATAS